MASHKEMPYRGSAYVVPLSKDERISDCSDVVPDRIGKQTRIAFGIVQSSNETN
jgi:hypothetical protein